DVQLHDRVLRPGRRRRRVAGPQHAADHQRPEDRGLGPGRRRAAGPWTAADADAGPDRRGRHRRAVLRVRRDQASFRPGYGSAGRDPAPHEDGPVAHHLQGDRPVKPLRMIRRGFSMVEMLIALTISSLLLTACLVALDTMFKFYETTSEEASTHVVSRLVM